MHNLSDEPSNPENPLQGNSDSRVDCRHGLAAFPFSKPNELAKCPMRRKASKSSNKQNVVNNMHSSECKIICKTYKCVKKKQIKAFISHKNEKRAELKLDCGKGLLASTKKTI